MGTGRARQRLLSHHPCTLTSVVRVRGLDNLPEQGQRAVEGRQPLLFLAAQLQQDTIQPMAQKRMGSVSIASQVP